MPIFRNGYGLCHGESYSPSNSGLNIDPRTFTFRTRIQDRMRYFPEKEEESKSPSPPPLKQETRTSSYPVSGYPSYNYSNYSVRESVTGRESATPTLGGESMICYPPSEYTEVFLRDMSEGSSPVPPVPPIPTGTDDFGYVKKHSVTFSIPDSHSESGTDSTSVSVRDSILCNPPSLYPASINGSNDPSLYPISNESSSQTNDETLQNIEESSSESSSSSRSKELSHTQSELEYNKHSRLYTPPKSKLRDETWDIMKAESVRSIVVSQTWLTGWIRELYILDDVINKRPGGVQDELNKG